MDNDTEKKYCPNCGAPLTTEICPYCEGLTGVETKDVVMEYPVIECKEASITFINFGLPLTFGLMFGIIGTLIPSIFLFSGSEEFWFAAMFCSTFALIGIFGFIFAIKQLVRYKRVKSKGKEIVATVYGYMNDMISSGQVVKLLVDTEKGKKFILYQLDNNAKLYKVNSKIKLIAYKDLFLIEKDKEYYF